MKQYSFLNPTMLEEGKIKSGVAGLLSLLGVIGAGSVKVPQSYLKSHPDMPTRLGPVVVHRILHPTKKVNWKEQLQKCMKMGMETIIPEDIVHTKELGDVILKTAKGKRGFIKNASDAIHGEIPI